MSGRATLATARLRLATAATRISAVRTSPARLGLLDSTRRQPIPAGPMGRSRSRPPMGGQLRHAPWRYCLAPMADDRKRPEAPRTEKVLPGIWRLRLPLPWPGVPHGNVWAVAADGGIVLFDTGIGGKGRMRQFDLALGPGRLRPRGRAAARLHPLPHRPLRAGGADRRGRRLRALDAPGLGTRSPARRRPGGGAGAAARGGAAERRACRRRWSATASPAATTTTTASTRSSSPTATCCPGSRSRPTSAPGRSTRRRATHPPTSSCTSPSAS